MSERAMKVVDKINFRDLKREEEASVNFLQVRGLLPSTKECQNGHHMKLYFGSSVFWKCNVKECAQKINMRVDNWFQNTRLSFEKIMCFMYSSAFEMTSIQWRERELKIGNNSAVDYNAFMRQICYEVLWQTTGIIGGLGMTVEIYESAYTQRKYHKGRLSTTTWVLRRDLP